MSKSTSNSSQSQVTKHCSKCGKEKSDPSEVWHKLQGKPSGFVFFCSHCVQVECESHRQKTSENTRRKKKAEYRLNREKYLYRAKMWAKANPAKVQKRNQDRDESRTPDQLRLKGQKRRALKIGLPNTLTEDEVRRCSDYFNGLCAACGSQSSLFNVIELDHFVPLSSPLCPGTVAGNMIPLCKSCNSGKRDREALEWATSRFGVRKAKQFIKRVEGYFASLK